MEIKGLFDALAGYLDFFIDFMLLRGMEQFARLGEISPTLVAYFVIGVFIAYLVSSMKKTPGYLLQKKAASAARDEVSPPGQQVPSPPSGVSDSHAENDVKKFQVDMAQFVVLSILGGFLFHGFLDVYAAVFGSPPISSVKDTLNAVFAYNAVYHPFNAFANKINRGAKMLAPLGGAPSAVAVALFVGLTVFYFGAPFYLLYALAAVHQTSIGSMILPSVAFVAVFIASFVLFFLSWGLPLNTIFAALAAGSGQKQ